MKCLTCVHFDFNFETFHSDYHLNVQFQVSCERKHFNHECNDMDTVELHNLICVGFSCPDYGRSKKICTGCGKRGHENNVWCPSCQQPFEEEVI